MWRATEVRVLQPVISDQRFDLSPTVIINVGFVIHLSVIYQTYLHKNTIFPLFFLWCSCLFLFFSFFSWSRKCFEIQLKQEPKEHVIWMYHQLIWAGTSQTTLCNNNNNKLKMLITIHSPSYFQKVNLRVKLKLFLSNLHDLAMSSHHLFIFFNLMPLLLLNGSFDNTIFLLCK